MGSGHFNVQKPDGLFNLLFSYGQNNVKMHISFQNLKLIYRQNIENMYVIKWNMFSSTLVL